jgi:hypothetical protein
MTNLEKRIRQLEAVYCFRDAKLKRLIAKTLTMPGGQEALETLFQEIQQRQKQREKEQEHVQH